MNVSFRRVNLPENIIVQKKACVYIYSSTKPIVYTILNVLFCFIYISISFLATDH